jgi:hypothetical protein
MIAGRRSGNEMTKDHRRGAGNVTGSGRRRFLNSRTSPTSDQISAARSLVLYLGAR